MGKTTGQKFIIETSLDEGATFKKVGSMQTKQLSRTRQTIETSSDDNPNWSEKITGQRSWGISGEALYVYDNEGQQAIEAAYESDDPVLFRFTQIDQQGTPVVGSNQFTGQGLVTDASLQASTNEVVKYSLSIEGTGALTRSSVSA